MAIQTITWMSAFLCLAQVFSMPMPSQREKCVFSFFQGGHFPLECLQENVFMAFPATSFATSGNTLHGHFGAAKAIYETLKNIDTLFGTDELPTMWDQQKLEYFQNIIYRQIEESECMSSVDTSDYPIRAEGLKTYFGNIAAVLKEKNFSYCAWEVVRKELLYTLEFILKHTSDMLILYPSPRCDFM
uniref:Interferon alpha-2-like n=1 Tax=Oncorhynchus tshawytscha TaxID=74940 RepID=A0AAZ3S589_ONCTS